MLRLAVRFLILPMPTPCAIKKPISFLSSKIFPPLTPFYSGYVTCIRVPHSSSSALQKDSVMDLLTAWGRPVPCRPGRLPHWGSEQGPFVICIVTFIHRAQDTWLREIQDQTCQPCQSHKLLCLLRASWEPCCWRRSILLQCLIALHNHNILCCRELPSS